MSPVTFTSETDSKMWLIAAMALGGALLLFGYGATPGLAASRRPTARAIAERSELVVGTGLVLLGSGAAFLLVVLITPALA